MSGNKIDKNFAFGSIVTGAIIVTVLCLIMNQCTIANKSYYEFATECVRSKGTWVPKGDSSSYSGICVGGTQTFTRELK